MRNKAGKVLIYWSWRPRAFNARERIFVLFCRQSFLNKGVIWALMKVKALNSDSNNNNSLGGGIFNLAFKNYNSNDIFNIKYA